MLVAVHSHFLQDGTRVAIRPIAPEDKQLLQDGLRRLSRESAEKRFLAPKARFSAKELRYLTELDRDDHVAIVAVNAADPSELIAVGRFVRLREDPRVADVAFTVADCHQGMGLGTYMGRLLAIEARERGIERFSATMRLDNEPAHRLLASISTHLHEGAEGFGVHDFIADLAA
jgi:RimJ/RimL family protein N-acetyltransferase